MPLTIQGNTCLPFSRAISDKRIRRAVESSSKEEAAYMGVWDKIKDWICRTKKSEALEKLYELTHTDHEPDTESALKTMISFYQLKEMTYPGFQNRFQASVTENEDGTYTFTFSIKDGMDERKLVYGNSEKDIRAFSEKQLTNHSEFLNINPVSRESVDAALAKVAYNTDPDKLEGISSSNQKRLYLHLLSGPTKQEMVFDQRLTQRWIALQMKCFDYYALQRFSLDSTEGIDLGKTIGTESEWIYDFAKSIDSIKKNIQKSLAEKFNNETNNLYDPIYADPMYAKVTDLNLDYSERTDNTLQAMTSNASELPVIKHYKGPVNGDIYATLGKKKSDKSELLRSIENYILANPKEFPSAYKYFKEGYIAG